MLWNVASPPFLAERAIHSAARSPEPAGIGLELASSCSSSVQALLVFYQTGHQAGQLSSFWEALWSASWENLPVGLCPEQLLSVTHVLESLPFVTQPLLTFTNTCLASLSPFSSQEKHSVGSAVILKWVS